MHSYNVMCEYLSAMEQLHLGQLYNCEHGIHMGEKLWRNQQCSTFNGYKKLDAKSGEILENILEWDGSFDEFSNKISEWLPIFPKSDLYTIEK